MHLLDTNVVSELMRPRPAPAVTRWAGALERFALSVIALEEIQYGLIAKPNSRLEGWFERFVGEFCDLLPVTEEIAARSAQLRGRFRAVGKPRTQADMLIAATAQQHGFVLVTRNERDFEGCGLRIVNPFSSRTVS